MIQPSRSFKHLKHTVPITTVFEDQGVISRFRKQGQRFIGPCPIHGGDNPNAFVISIPKNTWYCFTQCHAGGDLIDLVQKLLGYSYTQTADYLASLNPGLSLPAPSKILPSARFRPYTRQLTLDPFSLFLRKKGITPQTALRFETGAYHGPGFLHQTIGVRLCDLTGQPLGYAARRLNQTDIATYGKWRFPHNFPKSRILYNYHRIATAKPRILVITECPWGVMRLDQLSIPAVALLGTHLSEIQFIILRKIPRLLLMLDGDAAGRSAIYDLQNVLAPHTKVNALNLPNACDPDDLDDNCLLAFVSPFFLDQSFFKKNDISEKWFID